MKLYHHSFLFAYTHYSPTKFCPKKRRLGFGPLGTRIITLCIAQMLTCHSPCTQCRRTPAGSRAWCSWSRLSSWVWPPSGSAWSSRIWRLKHRRSLENPTQVLYSVHTLRKVLADFAVCDRWCYCKALCDVMFSQIDGNDRTFRKIV